MDTKNSTEARKAAPPRPSPIPRPVRVAQGLFYLIGVIWLVFGVVTSVNIFADRAGSAGAVWIIVILMFANAGLLIWVGRRLARQSRESYILALMVLTANILLTITDEFGFYDAATLVIDVVLFLFLIATRSRYNTQ